MNKQLSKVVELTYKDKFLFLKICIYRKWFLFMISYLGNSVSKILFKYLHRNYSNCNTKIITDPGTK